MRVSLLKDSELKRTVDESARLKQAYGHLFDVSIVNENLDETYQSLKASLLKLNGAQQWVPVGWVF